MSGNTGEPQLVVHGNVSVSITRTVTPRIVDARDNGVDNSPWVQLTLPPASCPRANGAIIRTVQLRFDDGSAPHGAARSTFCCAISAD